MTLRECGDRWMVRGQKVERGDQMCFPDKITLVPAPLIQNTHRYQLAQGTQGVCQSLHGQQVELVSVRECVCVSVAVYIFADAQNKGRKKQNKHATEDKQHSLEQMMMNHQDCLHVCAYGQL